MKFYSQPAYCSCGYAVMYIGYGADRLLTCSNHQCELFGRYYSMPSADLKEVDPRMVSTY